MLTASFVSAPIGTILPGYGTVYIRQEINFKAPAHIGDTLTARVEVLEVMSDKNRVRLKTTCLNQDGTVILDGEALVSPPIPPKE